MLRQFKTKKAATHKNLQVMYIQNRQPDEESKTEKDEQTLLTFHT